MKLKYQISEILVDPDVDDQDFRRKVWFNGVLQKKLSAQPFNYKATSRIGVAIQNSLSDMAMDAIFTNGRLCTPLTCRKDDGTIIKVSLDNEQESNCYRRIYNLKTSLHYEKY